MLKLVIKRKRNKSKFEFSDVRVQSEQFIRVRHILQERQWHQVREFANASREVDAADCVADGDPRELLQRQRTRVEVVNKLLQNTIFRLPRDVEIRVVKVFLNIIARFLESNTANEQVAGMQLAASEAECQKLIAMRTQHFA